MKSKRCSHNLQSDQQGFYQRICVLIMRITSKTILGILLMNSWDTQIYFFSNYYNFQSVYFEQINVLEKKQKHGGRRRDCFSLLYFGNSQFYCQILCRFSDIVCGFPFLLNNFPLQSLEYVTYSSVQLIRTTEELSYRAIFCCKPQES